MLHYLWIGTIVVALYLYFKNVYSIFSRYGVKNLPPIPLVGNLGSMILKQEHFVYHMDRLYEAFPDERFVGRFEGIKPIVMIRDIDLIKQITIKDFEHFVDRRSIVDEKTEPLFGRVLFNLKGQEWKDMRSTLSPAFTSSKIRLMLPFMVEVGNQMTKALENKCKESQGTGYIDVDVKDLTTRYANDVIASCAFGLKVDSLTDLNNQFYENGKEAANIASRHFLVFIGLTFFPRLMKLLNISLFTEATKNFFKNMVMSTMSTREEQNIIRPDMIHLLMEVKKGKLTHEETKTEKDADAGFATVEESAVGKRNTKIAWSDDDLVSQAVQFFIGGFDTVSTTMAFLLHELAVSPDVQEKLYREIMENEEKNGGKFDYNSIQHMKYMDMVVSELLRLWPPVMLLDRVCAKDYNLGRPNDKATQDYIVRKGEGAFISVWSIHRDPNYFPEPHKFTPERFSDENQHNIKPFSYMPFGMGPRNCIGSRFALCEVKVMAYQLLKEMELSPAAKTRIPAELDKNTFNLLLEGGHWVRMTPRN